MFNLVSNFLLEYFLTKDGLPSLLVVNPFAFPCCLGWRVYILFSWVQSDSHWYRLIKSRSKLLVYVRPSGQLLAVLGFFFIFDLLLDFLKAVAKASTKVVLFPPKTITTPLTSEKIVLNLHQRVTKKEQTKKRFDRLL